MKPTPTPVHEPDAEKGAELDSLAHLEERINRAVDMLARLKSEKDAAIQQLDAAFAARDAAQKEAEAAVLAAHKAVQELEDLKSERKQVRTRIEKLLGQMDLLSGS